jgi:hypothetical protein
LRLEVSSATSKRTCAHHLPFLEFTMAPSCQYRVIRGNDELGTVTMHEHQDQNWCTGTFVPLPAFARVQSVFEEFDRVLNTEGASEAGLAIAQAKALGSGVHFRSLPHGQCLRVSMLAIANGEVLWSVVDDEPNLHKLPVGSCPSCTQPLGTSPVRGEEGMFCRCLRCRLLYHRECRAANKSGKCPNCGKSNWKWEFASRNPQATKTEKKWWQLWKQ